jgi:cyclohexyl-isocyanide hydratase
MGKTITIGIPLFHGFDLLDMSGPHEMFSFMNHAWPGNTVKVLLVAAEMSVVSANGIRVSADVSFEDCPQLDVLFVPGGWPQVVEQVIATDPGYLRFVREQAGGAEWVASVCTGAFFLAATGLLDGYRATTYWSAVPALQESFPKVKVVNGFPRYVVDRNRLTGGGISSGLDSALALASLIAGDEAVGKRVQLMAQYHPQPPYHEGDPAVASYDTYAAVMAAFSAPPPADKVRVESLVGAAE